MTTLTAMLATTPGKRSIHIATPNGRSVQLDSPAVRKLDSRIEPLAELLQSACEWGRWADAERIMRELLPLVEQHNQ